MAGGGRDGPGTDIFSVLGRSSRVPGGAAGLDGNGAAGCDCRATLAVTAVAGLSAPTSAADRPSSQIRDARAFGTTLCRSGAVAVGDRGAVGLKPANHVSAVFLVEGPVQLPLRSAIERNQLFGAP